MNKINLKNNILNNLLLLSLFLIITLYLNPDFNFSLDSLKHWSTYHRDDIVFVYGTLIYNEGLPQEHLDHPSLFTFIFTALFYKIFYFFGFLDHYNLSGFINSEEEVNFSLSKLFFVSKFTIIFFSSLTIIVLNKIFNYLSHNSLNSFLLTCLFIFSTGFISSSNRLESGLISIFLIFLSIYFLIKFINKEDKSGIIFFILGLIFLFSSMMQKKIIFFSIPFMLLSLAPILKFNNICYINYKSLNRFLDHKILLFLLYLVVISFISYKTVINNTFFLSRDLDFVFLIVNYLSLNIILFYYIKYFQDSNYQNLLTYNLTIGITYLIYKYFLIYFFSAPIEIWSISFTNFLGHINMFVSDTNIKNELSFNSLYLYFTSFIEHLKFILIKYFLDFSYQSVLVWLNLTIFLAKFRKIDLIKKLTVIILFLGFFIVQSIILFRYEQDTYFLNSEILLIIPLIYLFRYLKNNKLIIIISVFLFSLNLSVINSKNLENSNSYCHDLIKSNDYKYYYYWTKHLPKNLILKFCKDLI